MKGGVANPLLVCLILGTALMKCASCASVEEPPPVPVGGLNMYEISTRPWLYSLSEKYGRSITTLNDIPVQEFKDLQKLGIDYIWMMGIWELGDYGLNHDKTNPSLLESYKQVLPDFTLDDVIGSPYAVVNYTCNPALGTDGDILALRRTLNDIGMKLMLDFVPNHSAVDSPLVISNPDYYVQCPQPPCSDDRYYEGKIAYGGTNVYTWDDTVQYNYWNPKTVDYRTAELVHVASLADGIRCDMAQLLLNDNIETDWGDVIRAGGYSRPTEEFWEVAIAAAKKEHPKTVFLAEVYHPDEYTLQTLGFEYTYEKYLYDMLNDGDLDSIRGYLKPQDVDYTMHCAHFVSNHDEQRAVAEFGSPERANAAGMVSFTLPGLRFFWMGLFDGYRAKLDVHLRREVKEEPVKNTTAFYDTLLPIISLDVFRSGNWYYSDVVGSGGTNWRLMAWRWESPSQKILVVVNYSDDVGGGNVVLPNAEGSGTITLTDLMSGTTYDRSAPDLRSSGLVVVVGAWSCEIFSY